MNTETDEIVTREENGGAETAVSECVTTDGPEDGAAASGGQNGVAELRAALSRAEERVTQLERERTLLSQGVAEEDLDYYVFKIGKLVTGEKDFGAAAKEFLKQRGAARRAPVPQSTGASLAGRSSSPRSTNDTMNRILRGSSS